MTKTGSVRGAEEPAEDSAALVGRVLSERYRIERHIRSSNMSHVYEGRDLTLQRSVAVKVLHEEILNERTLCRFFLEARIGRLAGENPHAVTVTDVGFTGRAVPYFVMEYLVGQDLAAHLREHRRVTPERAVIILLELCSAVAALHRAGVVHRDIKPSNVFLKEDGHVCLIDFGVCKLTDSDISLTHTGELVGSMHYVPPERWIDPDDARLCGDVWGLAVILYELLSGSLPFKGQSRDSLKQAILTHELTLGFDAHLPELHTVLLVALHKDPRYRYSTVPDFAAALGRAAFDAGLLAEPSFFDSPCADVQVEELRSIDISAAAPEIPTPPAAPSPRSVPGRRVLTWAIAALAVVSGVVALVATSLRGAAPASALAISQSSAASVSSIFSGVPATVEASSRVRAAVPLAQPPRSTPSARAPNARRSAGPTTPSTAALSKAQRVETALPRPANPAFGKAGAEPPDPPAPAPAPALDVTPTDLRHF